MSKCYEVQQILEKRIIKNRKYYLIKWVGYQIQESTWQPLKNLIYVKDMIQDFEKRLNQQQQHYLDQNQEQRQILNFTRSQDQIKYQEQQQQNEIIQNIYNISIQSQPYYNNEDQQYQEEIIEPHIRKIGRYEEIQYNNNRQSFWTNSIEQKPEQQQYSQEKQISETNLSNFEENVQILGASKNHLGEFIFCVRNQNGLQVFKSRSYILQNHPESLIRYYETIIQLIDEDNLQISY